MIVKAVSIAKRAWEYALRKSDFLRFIFQNDEAEHESAHKNDAPDWNDADWEGGD